MRTNTVLDEELVEEALRFGGAKSKRELIHNALREYVEHRRRLNLLDLEGKLEFSEGHDYKALREDR
jgi:Arc/MetJ family transcription regulator